MTTVSVSANQYSQAEGNSGSTPFVFTVALSAANTAATKVAWDLYLSGAAAADFAGGVSPTGTLTIAAGQTSKTLTINVAGDATSESDESFYLHLVSVPSGNATLSYNTYASTSITDDDTTRLAISATDAYKYEGNSGTTPFTFTVTRSGKLNVASSVGWRVNHGTYQGTDAADFANLAGTVSFASGQTSKVITVNVVGDTAAEPTESFSIEMINPVNAVLNSSSYYNSASGTVRDDDTPVITVAAQQSTQAEGNSGVAPFLFTVDRAGSSSGVSTVAWGVSANYGSTLTGADFVGGVLPTGTLSFSAGQTQKILTINVVGDTVSENSEGFNLTLSSAVGATLGSSYYSSTIIADDDTARFAIATISGHGVRTETDVDSQRFLFQVTRDGNLSGASSLGWTVAGGVTNPAGAADFVGAALPRGTVSFAAGETLKTLTVNVLGDDLAEQDETFQVNLATPAAGGVLTSGSASGSILDDDSPEFSISSAPLILAPEGNTGHRSPSIFWINRSGNANTAASVRWAVTGGGGGYYVPSNADATDFVGRVLPTGTMSFAVGQTQRALTILVVGDTTVEQNEAFQVTLSNPVGATLLNTTPAVGIIVNDDVAAVSATSLSVTPYAVSQYEGNSGATGYAFNIVRSGVLTAPTVVVWRANHLTYGDVTTNADFVGGALPGGTFTFAAGATSRLVTVRVAGDTAVEADEQFQLALSSPTAGVTVLSGGNGIIANDDGTPLLNLGYAAGQAEGNGGMLSAFVHTVARTGNLSAASTVAWAVTGSGANPANAADFSRATLPSGVLTFAAGASSARFTVSVLGDNVVELDESFTITLSRPTGARLGATSTLAAAITNDDSAVYRLSGETSFSQKEGDVGNTPKVFAVYRDNGLGTTGTVRWTVAGTVSNGATASDFLGNVLPTGVVTFAIGQASQQVTLNVLGDTQVETDENFTVTLSDPTNGTLSGYGASLQGSIGNDDTTIYSLGSVNNQPEGNRVDRPMVFPVQRAGGPLSAGSIRWQVTHQGNSTQQATSSDFAGGVMAAGLVSFAAGQQIKYVTVIINGDTTPEADEPFMVELFNPVGGSLNPYAYQYQSSRTITDDDTNIFSITTYLGTGTANLEGNSGTTGIVFEARREGPVSGTSTVRWMASGSPDTQNQGAYNATAALSANAADFPSGVFPTGVVTFAPGEACKRFTVLVAGDTQIEGDDQFAVTLTEATGGRIRSDYISQYQAIGTIVDDDEARITVTTTNTYQNEGNSGVTPYIFNFTRVGKTSGITTVNWSAGNTSGSLYSTPASAADLQGGTFPRGIITFAAGQTQKTVTVNVVGDTVVENSEVFSLDIGNISGGRLAIANNQSVPVTITDDDTATALATQGWNISGDDHNREGDTGANRYVYTVARSGTGLTATNLTWRAFGGGAGMPAASASDFIAATLPGGTLAFTAGQTSKTFTVSVNGDTLVEPEEGFTVQVTTSAGGLVASTASTIVDDDAPTFGVDTNYMSQAEGNSGASPLYVTIFRGGDTGAAGSVRWQMRGTENYANVEANDFVGNALPGGTVSFAAGQTSKLLTINVQGDTQAEPWEAGVVHLFNPVGGAITSNDAQIGIVDDDTSSLGFSYSHTQASREEGNSGSTPFVFTVQRSGSTSGAASAIWTMTNCPASSYYGGTLVDPVSANDIVGGLVHTGTVNFSAGQTQKTITISVVGDSTAENDEAFTLFLSDPLGAQLGTSTSTSTAMIYNDDAAYLSITTENSSRYEGNSGSTAFSFRAVRSGRTTGTSVVDWTLTPHPGGSLSVADFTANVLPSGRITFSAGQTQKSVTFNVRGDTTPEASEAFNINLSNPVNATIRSGSTYGSIMDDDTTAVGYTLYGSIPNQLEPDSGGRAVVFQVGRTATTAASIGWQVLPQQSYVYGTASMISGDDFVGGVLPSGTVSFAAGQTSRLITINIAGDTRVEDNETFIVQLTNGTQTYGVIYNDDSAILGTAGNDALAGTSGDDLLMGGAGLDTLAGFSGTDLFFIAAPNQGLDTIVDFNNDGSDMLLIQSSNFGNLPLGPLSSFSLTTPTTTGPTLLYDSATQMLKYDADGTRAGAAVNVARFQGTSSLYGGSILVVSGLS